MCYTIQFLKNCDLFFLRYGLFSADEWLMTQYFSFNSPEFQ